MAAFESSPGTPRSWLSYADFADWKHLNGVFSSMDAYALNGSFTLNADTGAEQVTGTRVSAGFFHTLGIQPVLGRDFRNGEDAPDAQRTVILSYTAWQKVPRTFNLLHTRVTFGLRFAAQTRASNIGTAII